jgi:hypothetical protein
MPILDTQKNKIEQNMTIIMAGIILVLILLAFAPLITIWALNTLFPALNIPYTFSTWFATLWIGWYFYGPKTVKKDK